MQGMVKETANEGIRQEQAQVYYTTCTTRSMLSSYFVRGTACEITRGVVSSKIRENDFVLTNPRRDQVLCSERHSVKLLQGRGCGCPQGHDTVVFPEHEVLFGENF